jgi:hypothetical protein
VRYAIFQKPPQQIIKSIHSPFLISYQLTTLQRRPSVPFQHLGPAAHPARRSHHGLLIRRRISGGIRIGRVEDGGADLVALPPT